MHIPNPVKATKKYFSDKLDNFYVKALCPDNNRLAWFMKDMMRATPNRKSWNRFFVDSDFDLLRHAGQDIAILADDRNTAMLFNECYIQQLKITYPEPFLDLSNQVLQAAYMAAYYYPASKNEAIMMNNSIGLIQGCKGTLSHTYEFQHNSQYKNNIFEHRTQILKRKGHEDIFICRFEVGSIYDNEKISVFVGYDSEHLYYEYHPSESGSVFVITPIDIDSVMNKFTIVTRDELFKNLTVDLIGFMTGVKPANIPTQRDKTLLDMIEI